MAELIFADNPSEECGVFGIYAPGRDVARLTFFGLYALQHRGQEGAGIASSDGKAAYIHKGTGLVTQVFNEDNLRPLKGHLAIGHNRYSTTGAPHVRNVQPYLIETLHGPLGVAHNGNLTNALDLRKKLLERGVGLSSSSDTEVITQMLAAPANIWANGHTTTEVKDEPDRWVARLRAFMQLSDGAYSIAVLTRDALYAVRDPYGLRPLCLGELPEGGHVVASESCALLTVGARYLREIEPGEIVRLDEAGVASYLSRPALP
ncbi:MAG TPA: class II glutamine amidotransferase, partial [Anaerolineae bacterium]|nr:class II glutamine amidotransferase [Anaerolineae bacterium]